MKTNVAIVVPNWNGKEFLGDCLRSLEKQTKGALIITVDNGSTDGSADFVRQKFPEIELLAFGNNAGFAGGVNRGIRYALKRDCEFVALFNNDAVADEKWLEHLLKEMKADRKTSIVTGKLMRADKKRLDSTGELLKKNGMPFPRGRDEIDAGQYDKVESVFGATGGASLYRAKMLKEVGLFDEDFFAYFEDVDISFRARLAGWNVRYTPAAIAYHHIGGTSGKLGAFTRYHSIKNFILLYNKNMPGRLLWKYLPLFLVQLFRMLLGSVRDKQFGAFAKALGKALLLTPSTLRKRHAIQSNRVLSTAQVDQLLYKGRPPKPPRL